MFTLAFIRSAIALATATLLSGVSSPAQAGTSASRTLVRPLATSAQRGTIAPLSLAWRKEFMLRHGFKNHAGAPGMLPPLSLGKYLYVADYDLSVIFVYDATSKTNPAPIGFIADGVSYPAAIAFDSKNNLYVANEGTSTITVYAPGSTKVAQTVATIFPFAMAFGTDGTLYVTGNDATAGNEVEIFTPNQPKPTFIATPFGDQSDGVAVSPTNILTLTIGNSNKNGYVYSYPNGPTKTPVEVAGNIGLLEGLAFDTKQNAYVSAYSENQVLVYPPSWQSPQTISNGIGAPVGLTVGTSGLFVANSSVPSVTSYASVSATPTYFTQDMVFVTSVALSDTTLAANAEKNLYVTQECNCSEVDIYSATPKNPIKTGTIVRGVHTPNGVWLDDAQNLWVANYGTHVVSELAPKTHAPIRFLSLNRPYSVAVDHAGTVYVVDQGNDNVAVFAPGASTPSRALNDCASGNTPQYMTIDSANNMYLACRTDVIKYAPGAKTGKHLNLTQLNYAFGVALDAGGNLYVADYLGNAVNVYAPNTTAPSRVITAGIDIPSQIAIGASGRLYVANLSGNKSSIYAPGGSTPIGTIPGNLQGITTGP